MLNLIIPTCDDSNRGDQALVWQTRALAQRAGYEGRWCMLASVPSNAQQSAANGFELAPPVLRHPRQSYRDSNNVQYGAKLTAAWGLIAIKEFLTSASLLTRPGRRLAKFWLDADRLGTLKTFQAANAIFVKGGGFIHSTQSRTDLYRAYHSLYHVLLAQALGKPVIVMPNSFGPFKGFLYNALIKRALKRCELITTRETISHQMLADLGVEASTYPDLGFSLPARDTPGTDMVAKYRAQYPGRNMVAITARPYRFPGHPEPKAAYDSYVRAMADFCEWVFASGSFPILVEHVHSAGTHESDLQALTAIRAHLADGHYGVIADEKFDSRDLKATYRDCDVVVGTRFHSVIFALSEGTPAIAIAYGGNKGQGIMKDLGLSSCVIDIEDFTAARGRIAYGHALKVKRSDLASRAQSITAELDNLVAALAGVRSGSGQHIGA